MGEKILTFVSKRGHIFNTPLTKALDEKANWDEAVRKMYQVLKPQADFSEFAAGMKEELEHKDVTGGDLGKTGQIVMAHLKEDKNYYSKLQSAMKKGGPGSGRYPEGSGKEKTTEEKETIPWKSRGQTVSAVIDSLKSFGSKAGLVKPSVLQNKDGSTSKTNYVHFDGVKTKQDISSAHEKLKSFADENGYKKVGTYGNPEEQWTTYSKKGRDGIESQLDFNSGVRDYSEKGEPLGYTASVAVRTIIPKGSR